MQCTVHTTTNSTETFGFPYDLSSVMHYHKFAFSKNAEPTIETVDSSEDQNFGFSDHMSDLDARSLKAAYSCPPVPSPPPPPPAATENPTPSTTQEESTSLDIPFASPSSTPRALTGESPCAWTSAGLFKAADGAKDGDVLRWIFSGDKEKKHVVYFFGLPVIFFYFIRTSWLGNESYFLS